MLKIAMTTNIQRGVIMETQSKTSVFKERLLELIKERKINQRELAEGIGISKQTISFYVNGKRLPDIDIFSDLCEYFEVSADYLLGITDFRSSNIDNKEIHQRLGLSDKAIATLVDIKENQIVQHRFSTKSIDEEVSGKIENHAIPESVEFSDIVNAIIENKDFSLRIGDIYDFLHNKSLLNELKKQIKLDFENAHMDPNYIENAVRNTLRDVLGEHSNSEFLNFELLKTLEKGVYDLVDDLSEEVQNTKVFAWKLENLKKRYKDSLKDAD